MTDEQEIAQEALDELFDRAAQAAALGVRFEEESTQEEAASEQIQV